MFLRRVVASLSVTPALYADPGPSQLPAHLGVLGRELVPVLAMGFQGSRVRSPLFDLFLSPGSLPSLVARLADAMTGRVDIEVVTTKWVTVHAVNLTAVVAKVLFCAGYWFEVTRCAHAVGVTAPRVPDVVDGQPLRNGAYPELVGVPVSPDSDWLASVGIAVREDSVPFPAFVDLPEPAPAAIGISGLVHLADEQLVSGEPVGCQWTGGKRVAVLQEPFVVTLAPASPAGLGQLVAAGFIAGMLLGDRHNAYRNMGGDPHPSRW